MRLLAVTWHAGDEVILRGFVGRGGGEKLIKAQKLGLAILDEAGLRALLEG